MTKDTTDPTGATKRPRGRPPLGDDKKSHAVRKREERDRLRAVGIGFATFKLPLVIIDKLGAHAKAANLHQDEIVEQPPKKVIKTNKEDTTRNRKSQKKKN